MVFSSSVSSSHTITAPYVLYVLYGCNKYEAYSKIQNLDYSLYKEETIEVYHRILKENISQYDVKDISSSGYIVDTLEASLWMLLNTNSYKETIIGSINFFTSVIILIPHN